MLGCRDESEFLRGNWSPRRGREKGEKPTADCRRERRVWELRGTVWHCAAQLRTVVSSFLSFSFRLPSFLPPTLLAACLSLLETGSHHIVQAAFELAGSLLPQPPSLWGDGWALPGPVCREASFQGELKKLGLGARAWLSWLSWLEHTGVQVCLSFNSLLAHTQGNPKGVVSSAFLAKHPGTNNQMYFTGDNRTELLAPGLKYCRLIHWLPAGCCPKIMNHCGLRVVSREIIYQAVWLMGPETYHLQPE